MKRSFLEQCRVSDSTSPTRVDLPSYRVREQIEDDGERLAMRQDDLPPLVLERVVDPRIREDRAVQDFERNSDQMHRATDEDDYARAWFDCCRSVFPQSAKKAGSDVDLYNVSTYHVNHICCRTHIFWTLLLSQPEVALCSQFFVSQRQFFLVWWHHRTLIHAPHGSSSRYVCALFASLLLSIPWCTFRLPSFIRAQPHTVGTNTDYDTDNTAEHILTETVFEAVPVPKARDKHTHYERRRVCLSGGRHARHISVQHTLQQHGFIQPKERISEDWEHGQAAFSWREVQRHRWSSVITSQRILGKQLRACHADSRSWQLLTEEKELLDDYGLVRCHSSRSNDLSVYARFDSSGYVRLSWESDDDKKGHAAIFEVKFGKRSNTATTQLPQSRERTAQQLFDDLDLLY